jgi:hypothetical protein
MMLREELRKRLLEDRGVYVKECCDKCGQLLGPIRYTRKDDSGVWCSRECRGDGAQIIRKGGRPRKYRNGEAARAAKTAQQKNYRSVLSVEKTVCIQSETKDLQEPKQPLSHHPLTLSESALESPGIA